jgi:hypothetical protein
VDEWAAHKALLLAEPAPPIAPDTDDAPDEHSSAEDSKLQRQGVATPRRRMPLH